MLRCLAQPTQERKDVVTTTTAQARPSVMSLSRRNLLINNDTGHQELNKEVVICSYIVRIHLDTYCRYREDDGGPKTAARRDADTCAFKCNQGSYNINSEWPLFTQTGAGGGSIQSYKEY